MKIRSFLAGAIGLLAVASSSAPSLAAGNWDYLGSKRVNFLLDHDKIHVGLVRGTFDNILVKVRGNGLFMYGLKVTYKNGSVQQVPLRFHFKQGSHSRVVHLAGSGNRIIQNVQMTYGKPLNGKGATWVELFGRH